MKLFAYTTRSIRATEQVVHLVAKRAESYQFRLVNDKNQVKLIGTAIFRLERSDTSKPHFKADAQRPLLELGAPLEATSIEYFYQDDWHTCLPPLKRKRKS